MIIITNCERIDMKDYDSMHFDFDKAMVAFRSIKVSDELYFLSDSAAKEFVLEIIEAVYNRQTQIDLSHFSVVPSKLHIKDVTTEIHSRLKKR